MNTLAMGRMTGVAVGVMVGLLIAVILIKFWNKDGKAKTEYDEMQERERGKAYKWAFWAVVAYECVMAVLATGDVKLPLEGFGIHMLAILLGAGVQAGYCIWHDAYIGINTNMGRFFAICVVITLVNLAVAGMGIAHGEMLKDGVFQLPFVNLVCALLFGIMGVELGIKLALSKQEKEEE